MARITTLNSCCGVMEIDGVSLNTPKEVLLSLLDWEHEDYDYNTEKLLGNSRNVVFTDVAQMRRNKQSGWGFAKFITENKLGTITGPSPGATNPGTRNKVHVWVWTPNVKAIEAWFAAEQKRREKDEEEDW